MLDSLKASYHTESAYKLAAKTKSDIEDAPYYKQIEGSLS